MNDQKIIDLLFDRSEVALGHLQTKFGKYCHTIAYNVLGNESDAQECVNDAYLSVWNSIPPDRPKNLAVYIGHITRNISVNLMIKNSTKKRGSCADLVLDELAEIVTDDSSDFSDSVFIKQAIKSFIDKLSAKDRRIFIQRYWYSYSVEAIANSLDRDENYVYVKLSRLRASFKKHLEKEGIIYE